MNRDRDCPPIGVLHHVMAASNTLDNESGALERLNNLRSRDDWDTTRHKPRSYQKSGNAECQSQLVRWLNYIEQGLKRGAQVGDRLFLRRAIADRANARTKLGGSAPDAVLILLDDVGHVNDTSHNSIMHAASSTEASELTISHRSF